jgi:hypothetical protein
MSARPVLEVVRELKRVVVPALEADEEQARRERIARRVLELQRELAARRKRRLRLGVLLAAIVSIAGAALIIRGPAGSVPGLASSVRIVSGTLGVKDGGATRAWTEPTIDLAREPVLETGANETAALELPSAAAIEVSASSELGIARRPIDGGWSERIRLESGAVALRVPKLAGNQRLAVVTSDATVEVRGTRFAVHVERDARGRFTRVDVAEGRVAVSSERGPALLGPGEHWTSREPGAPAPPPVPSAEPAPALPSPSAPIEQERAEPAPRATQTPPVAAVTRPAPGLGDSALAEQNRLFQGAALAKRSGLTKLALERLETLLERYPTSELAHNARVEHFRLLRDTGQAESARASARRYLERYPEGFAAAEAERVLDGAGRAP